MRMQDDAARLHALVREAQIGMLVTADGTGLRARPIAVYPEPEGPGFYCFSDARGAKDDEVAAEPEICLTVTLAEEGRFGSISCRARVERDRGEIARRWTDGAQAWFPDGPDDRNVLLMRLLPEWGEIWERDPETAQGEVEAARSEGRRPQLGGSRKVTFTGG